jgi:hypothetical protein
MPPKVAQHNGLLDADSVAEGANVVAPLRQVPVRRVAMLAAAVAAVVEIDELGDICEMGKEGLKVEWSPPGAVQQQDRALAHMRPSGTSFAPSTSKKRRVLLTVICMVSGALSGERIGPGESGSANRTPDDLNKNA